MKRSLDFETIKGKQTVLFSAPHVHNHKRPSLSSKYKQGEPWTEYILKNACSESDSNGIYVVREIGYDPNYHKVTKNEYKKSVRDLIREKKIKYFIDIHGLNNEHQYDFGIYYLNRYSNSKKLAHAVADALNKGSLRDCLIQILNIPVGNQEPLTQFVSSELKVPSVQVEISRQIRERNNLRDEVVTNLCELLTTLS
jgi:hypothetical protein